MTFHRRLIALRGHPGKTLEQATHLVSRLPAKSVLWADRRARRFLGQSFEAVILDFHHRPDAELLALCQGFVWGGGALILRLPERYPEATPFTTRFVRLLREFIQGDDGLLPLSPLNPEPRGTPEQAEVVERLLASLARGSRLTVLTAGRGRGKSSALGLALSRVRPTVVLTGPSQEAAAELLKFAERPLEFVPVRALLEGSEEPELVVVDEAAQLGLPRLRELVLKFPQASFWMATTVGGYEGSGRGFLFRFLEWLERGERPFEHLRLERPVRWADNDPVEQFVHRALLLDLELPKAEPSEICEPLELERATLSEARLSEFFSLFVLGHYCTSPRDLQQLLDGPGIRLHALQQKSGGLVAATMVNQERVLTSEEANQLYQGRLTVSSMALRQYLVERCGCLEAASLTLIRSVRISVHPHLRGQGLGTQLVEAVHQAYRPDLFGTLFGATAELMRFRRRLGYLPVRLTGSRGRRSGEPSVLMLRPVTPEGLKVCQRLRRELAQELPTQLLLYQADGLVLEGDEFVSQLCLGLPQVSPPSLEECIRRSRRYLEGPQTFESVAGSVKRWVEQLQLEHLSPPERSLVESRVLRCESWSTASRASGCASARQAMRALKRALRSLL